MKRKADTRKYLVIKADAEDYAMKYLMQADLVSAATTAEQARIFVNNPLMWRGRAYLIVEADSRENAFDRARSAGIEDAKGWGVAAEGDDQIRKALDYLGVTPYWTTADAAAAWEMSEIRVRQLCQAGRVRGAAKEIDGANVVWRFPAQGAPEKIKPGKKK